MLNNKTVHIYEVFIGEEAASTDLPVAHIPNQRGNYRSEIRILQIKQQVVGRVDRACRLNQELQFFYQMAVFVKSFEQRVRME